MITVSVNADFVIEQFPYRETRLVLSSVDGGYKKSCELNPRKFQAGRAVSIEQGFRKQAFATASAGAG